MTGAKWNWVRAAVLAGCLFAGTKTTLAQGQSPAQGSQGSGQSGSDPAAQKPAESTGSSLEITPAPPPANAEEEAAYKAFDTMPVADAPKKIAAGEEFVQKYPESRYRPMVYSLLVFEYIQQNNTQKAFEVGEKELALRPDDVRTLAILGQAMSRAITKDTPEPGKQLAKAEIYSKKAIELTPTIPKPDGVSDQEFVVAKNATLAIAHSGLGLADFRRGKYTDAIAELETSIKIDPNPTPDVVNLYLLGMADQKASRFDDAASAFSKCAAMTGGLQQTCKSGADEAKKQAGTQLSAPK